MTTTVCLICENVDLGYRVIDAYFNKDAAEARVAALNAAYVDQKIEYLMAMPNPYTRERAEQWVANYGGEFFIEYVEAN
jgi:hypothetical protein